MSLLIAGGAAAPPPRTRAVVEEELAAALVRITATESCPRYLERVAEEWLTLREKDSR